MLGCSFLSRLNLSYFQLCQIGPGESLVFDFEDCAEIPRLSRVDEDGICARLTDAKPAWLAGRVSLPLETPRGLKVDEVGVFADGHQLSG